MSRLQSTRALIPLRNTIALLLLFVISLGLRVYPAAALHFDGLYGQDPFAYYSYGQQVRDAVANLRLPGHFYWPLGYPALVAVGFAVTGDQPLGPQVVSMLSGAAISILALALTIEIAQTFTPNRRYARIAGLIAWAVIAVCGQLIQSSMVIMSDAPALMWATMSAWALAVYARTRRPGWIVMSAFALAWATMTRWQYGGLALPWSLYVVLNRPFRWRHAALAVIVGLITLTPQIAHSIRYPDPLLGHMWLQGWAPANALGHDFTTADGTFHYDQNPAEYYAQPISNVYYQSPFFLVFLALGLIILVRRKLSFLLLIGWIAVEYGFLAGIPYENIRFALAIVPPVAVFVGLGAAWLLTFAPARSMLRLIVVPITILVIIYGLISTFRASAPLISNFVRNKDNDLAAALWVRDQISEPNATIYCLDLLLTMEHYTTLHPIQIYGLTPETLSADLPQVRPAYAVFNLGTTEHQWYGKSPWVIYHWLNDHPGLIQIGTFGNYTLYRIGQ